MTTSTPTIPMSPFDGQDSRWDAIINRRNEAEHEFLYAVRTTGIYCRPTCSSRKPRRENVEFFDSSSDAELAGYRACKRCKPNCPATEDRRTALVRHACRRIEACQEIPSLQQLADEAGLSPSRFHRVFRHVAGVTPKQFAAAVQTRRVQDGLLNGESVTSAVFAAGFNSGSRFYEKSARLLGMQPSAYSAGAADQHICFAVTETQLGCMLVAATRVGVCSIAFADTPGQLEEELRGRFPNASISEGDAAFQAWISEVADRIDTQPSFSDLPLDIQGTAFMRRVWSSLQEIPVGQTRTYLEVAEAIGNPTAVRAVASACAKNPVAVVIPCHRVVRSDGGLGGYRWGLSRKRELLDRESRHNNTLE